MPDERFMVHHYGPSGYVKPEDSPLTPWGEQLARVQEMCTEGYAGLSQRDKDDIRAVYHRMLDLASENQAMRAEIDETMKSVSKVIAKQYTSLHCDAGDHEKCFWTGKPDSAYPERIDKRCICQCHRAQALTLEGI